MSRRYRGEFRRPELARPTDLTEFHILILNDSDAYIMSDEGEKKKNKHFAYNALIIQCLFRMEGRTFIKDK